MVCVSVCGVSGAAPGACDSGLTLLYTLLPLMHCNNKLELFLRSGAKAALRVIEAVRSLTEEVPDAALWLILLQYLWWLCR